MDHGLVCEWFCLIPIRSDEVLIGDVKMRTTISSSLGTRR